MMRASSPARSPLCGWINIEGELSQFDLALCWYTMLLDKPRFIYNQTSYIPLEYHRRKVLIIPRTFSFTITTLNYTSILVLNILRTSNQSSIGSSSHITAIFRPFGAWLYDRTSVALAGYWYKSTRTAVSIVEVNWTIRILLTIIVSCFGIHISSWETQHVTHARHLLQFGTWFVVRGICDMISIRGCINKYTEEIQNVTHAANGINI